MNTKHMIHATSESFTLEQQLLTAVKLRRAWEELHLQIWELFERQAELSEDEFDAALIELEDAEELAWNAWHNAEVTK
jgi:hypothetical protein